MPKAKYGKPQAPQKHRDWLDHFGNVILIFTFLSALAAAIFTGYQACISSEQLVVIRDTEKRQIRGYLGITEMKFDCGDRIPDEGNNIEIRIENYGSTPGVITGGDLWMTPFKDTEKLPPAEWRRQFVAGILMTEMTFYPRDPRGIPFPIRPQYKELIDKVRIEGGWLAIRGFISYRDVFDDWWANHFCFEYRPMISPSKRRFTGCAKYNREQKLHPQPGYPTPDEIRRELAKPPP